MLIFQSAADFLLKLQPSLYRCAETCKLLIMKLFYAITNMLMQIFICLY